MGYAAELWAEAGHHALELEPATLMALDALLLPPGCLGPAVAHPPVCPLHLACTAVLQALAAGRSALVSVSTPGEH